MDKTKYYKELGNNLRTVREKNELTQKDIATKLGITYQQYQKYEKGKNRIPTDSLEIFCKMVNCNVTDITGSTNLADYEKVYKERSVHYNNSTTHVHNYYYGFLSKLFNMDLSLMKNKIVVLSVLIAILAYIFFDVLKGFHDLDLKYHMVFVNIQKIFFLTAFTIALFAVFGYSLLTYGVALIVYKNIYSLIWRWIEVYSGPMPAVGIKRVVMYIIILVLTFLTFYILRKCKVNLDTDLETKKKLA